MRNLKLNRQKHYTQKNHTKSVILLLYPYVLALIGIYIISAVALNLIISNSTILNFVINKGTIDTRNNISETTIITSTESDFDNVPFVEYKSQWATLNVENSAIQNIAVYSGDTDEILEKGAGQNYSTGLCGQNSRITISGNSATYFYDLEYITIGTIVTMDTTYGKYYYKVTNVVTYPISSNYVFMPDDSKEQLILTTTFPNNVSADIATKRIAVFCDRVDSNGNFIKEGI